MPSSYFAREETPRVFREHGVDLLIGRAAEAEHGDDPLEKTWWAPSSYQLPEPMLGPFAQYQTESWDAMMREVLPGIKELLEGRPRAFHRACPASRSDQKPHRSRRVRCDGGSQNHSKDSCGR